MIKKYTLTDLKNKPNEPVSKYLTLKDVYLNTALSSIKIDDDLLKALDKMMDHFGKPVQFASKNSLYRSQESNKAAGGAKSSMHLKGMAADFSISGVSEIELARYAEKIGLGGIGVYRNTRHIHMDTRSSRTCWWLVTSNSKTPGFGGVPTTYRRGNRSPAIQDIQRRLNALGIQIGSIDGVFGPKTETAVKNFQKSKALVADGVVGAKTWAALGLSY